ncbi:MAG TPA: EamA family transporter [Polyangiales bacterium]|nr:EamA family transporter [Polyangiales bacterium]
MGSHALALVLASALLHALWNALLKREDDIEVATVGVLAVAAVSSALLVPFSAGAAFPIQRGFLWALGAGVFEGGYFVALAMALLRAPLGFAYTVARGGAIALVWPISVVLLGESLTPLAIGGVVVLWLGLLSVGLGGDHRASSSGLRWSLLCALGIAGYHLCYKEALADHALPAALFAVSLAIALPANLLRLGPDKRARLYTRLRLVPRSIIASGLICTAAFVVFLNALALAGAGAVLTLRNTSVVFAQLLAFMIGERLPRTQVIGALLIALGAALIGWPR